MARPNSLLTRLRGKIARRLEPWPDRNEGWCIGCAVNDGRTVVVPVSGLDNHVELHRRGDPGGPLNIKYSEPPD